MKRLFVLLLLFISMTVSSKTLVKRDSGRKVLFVNYLKVNISCPQKKCRARQIADSPPKYKQVPTGKHGKNPTSIICESLKGTAEILKNPKSQNQVSICRFEDGSRLISWDLYRKIFN